MKKSGIVRPMGRAGRMAIPFEIRESLGLFEGCCVDIFIDGDSLILRKYVPGCIFCGDIMNLKELHGKLICPECVKMVNKL